MNPTVHIETSTFKGLEDSVLEILNSNRPIPQTKEYLTWRYLGEISPVDPIIFWVVDENSEKVGLSSLIFRAYWIDGQKRYIGVRGDTSLNKEFRGKGIGKRLLLEMRQHLENSDHPCAFGLANTASQRASEAAGWSIDDVFVPYVAVLDSFPKINKIIKNEFFSKFISRLFDLFFALKFFMYRDKNIRLVEASSFDEMFDAFWDKIEKSGQVTRDRSVRTLTWRYSKHPHIKFEIAKILRNDTMIGYIIYQLKHTEETDVCNVYDVAIKDLTLLKASLINFIVFSKARHARLNSIRIHLNSHNVYAHYLKKAGFFKRPPSGVIAKQFNYDSFIADAKDWTLFLGDKDI